MAVAEFPIQVLQNQDFSIAPGYSNGDPSGNLALATAVSFSGATAKMQVRQDADPTSTEYLALTSPSGGIVFSSGDETDGVNTYPAGIITITITAAQTAAMPVGVFYYDLLVTQGTGIKDYYLSGSFQVVGTGTR